MYVCIHVYMYMNKYTSKCIYAYVYLTRNNCWCIPLVSPFLQRPPRERDQYIPLPSQMAALIDS